MTGPAFDRVMDARGLALVADRLADLEDALGGGPR